MHFVVVMNIAKNMCYGFEVLPFVAFNCLAIFFKDIKVFSEFLLLKLVWIRPNGNVSFM